MATYAPSSPYIEGTRRSAVSPVGSIQPAGYGVGTAALNEDQVLRDLLAQLQSFTNSTAPAAAVDPAYTPAELMGGGEMTQADNTGGPQINPDVLSGFSMLAGPVSQLTNNEQLALLGNVSGLAGGLANAAPIPAALAMTQNFANLAGANPLVTGTLGGLLGAALDPVPLTNQDIGGKILDIALSKTPLNIISSLLTGKTIGQQMKGAMTPVETAVPGGSISDLLAEQANQLGKEANADPLDALMSITNSFGTGPIETPSSGMQMIDLAASMIGMPGDPGIAAIAMDPSVQAAAQTAPVTASVGGLSEFGPSLSDILAAQDAFNAEAPVTMDSAGSSVDLTSIEPGIAGFGMDVAVSDTDADADAAADSGMGDTDGASVW